MTILNLAVCIIIVYLGIVAVYQYVRLKSYAGQLNEEKAKCYSIELEKTALLERCSRLDHLDKEYNKLSKNIFLNFRFQHIIKKHNKEYYFNEKYASSTLKRTLYVFFKTLIIFSSVFIILLILI